MSEVFPRFSLDKVSENCEDSCSKLMSIVFENKDKLSDKVYKEMCERIKEVKDRNINVYKVTIFCPYLEHEHKERVSELRYMKKRLMLPLSDESLNIIQKSDVIDISLYKTMEITSPQSDMILQGDLMCINLVDQYEEFPDLKIMEHPVVSIELLNKIH